MKPKSFRIRILSKPSSIISLIESIEHCKLTCCTKSRGHYMFYRKAVKHENPHLQQDECWISCLRDKESGELHLLYTYVESGKTSKRII